MGDPVVHMRAPQAMTALTLSRALCGTHDVIRALTTQPDDVTCPGCTKVLSAWPPEVTFEYHRDAVDAADMDALRAAAERVAEQVRPFVDALVDLCVKVAEAAADARRVADDARAIARSADSRHTPYGGAP